MDLNFFNTKRKAYDDALAQNMQEEEDGVEEQKTPSLLEVAKGKWNRMFSPNINAIPTVGSTLTPARNLMDDIDLEGEGEQINPTNSYAIMPDEESESIVPAGRKEWMKLKRVEKRDWAYDNQGIGSDMVQLKDDDIDNMKVPQLNLLYDQVMEARTRRK